MIICWSERKNISGNLRISAVNQVTEAFSGQPAKEQQYLRVLNGGL